MRLWQAAIEAKSHGHPTTQEAVDHAGAVLESLLRDRPLLQQESSWAAPEEDQTLVWFATTGKGRTAEGTARLALRPVTRLPMIAVRGTGVFAAIAFDQPAVPGRPVEIAGDVLTGPRIARVFGRVYGLPVRFQQLPIEQLPGVRPGSRGDVRVVSRRIDDEPGLSHLRALHPDMPTLAAWARGQSSIVGDHAQANDAHDGSEEA